MQKDINTLIKNLIREEVQNVSAYHVADSNKMLKLDAMENPYSWPSELRETWSQELTQVQLNRYPHTASPDLLARLQKAMQIPEKYEILLGNGSDELIQILALAMASGKQNGSPTILASEPTFSMYRIIANIAKVRYVGVESTTDFQFDLSKLLAAIEQYDPQIIFIAQPNNPTGHLYHEKDICDILVKTNGLVVIDEAYTFFTDNNSLALLDEYPNLLILRTLSKLGLAGLRFGFLIGLPEWIEQFDKCRLPYNINSLTQMSVNFALQNNNVLLGQAKIICQQREKLFAELNNINQIKVWPSHANFLLIKTLEKSAQDIHNSLLQHNILIKCLDGSHPLLENCLRVTIGTEEENNTFLKVFRGLL